MLEYFFYNEWVNCPIGALRLNAPATLFSKDFCRRGRMGEREVNQTSSEAVAVGQQQHPYCQVCNVTYLCIIILHSLVSRLSSFLHKTICVVVVCV